MVERELSFDLAGHTVDAVQRAAYRFSDRLSCEITVGERSIDVRASILDEDADADVLTAEFRNEVLDQVLRERIRDETGDVRNLILALAFSRTGLADTDG
jgi:His-Xaa-Ser system protein HxsD